MVRVSFQCGDRVQGVVMGLVEDPSNLRSRKKKREKRIMHGKRVMDELPVYSSKSLRIITGF